MKPDILNPKWTYIPSAETDLRKTFARIRREQKTTDIARAPVVATIEPKKARGLK
jgi:hypothetical protein